MSEAQEFDVTARIEAPLHGSEVAILRGALAYQRDTLRWKCAGLTGEQLAQQCPPTGMTLGGLMKHLSLVESQWFDHWFRDAGYAPPFDGVDWAVTEDDWEFESARDDPPEELRALFDEAVRRSDAVVDEALTRGGLDEESVRRSPKTAQTFTLRWILVHMIEEYARHNGHADLIRESIDGQTG
ncbi:DinB family protein [Kribbella ginsengisoli]|uniref:DinB family protein n=1 Tax=Kribbella ginsengisoli TaxID=363865 RepID=A0ABP6WH94_9ACTN